MVWDRDLGSRRETASGGLFGCLAAAGLTWLALSVGVDAGYRSPSRGAASTSGAAVLEATAGVTPPATGAVPAARRVPSVPVPRVRKREGRETGEGRWDA